MTTTAFKKKLEHYIPLLNSKQQALLLEMVENILQVEPSNQRITAAQYNKELNASIRQAKSGKTVKHKDLLKEIEKW